MNAHGFDTWMSSVDSAEDVPAAGRSETGVGIGGVFSRQQNILQVVAVNGANSINVHARASSRPPDEQTTERD